MLLLVGLLACAGSDPETDPLQTSLQQALDAAREQENSPGASFAVRFDGALYTGGSGVSDHSSERAVRADDTFRIGSITKTFVAAVVLQLVEEGRLSLDDSLADFGFRYAWNQITVQQLLEHSSGLEDYVVTGELLASYGDRRTDAQLIDIIADEPLRFEPGTDVYYSNSNYVLLGMVICEVTGAPWGDAVQQRLLVPLGLDVQVPSVDGGEPTVHGHMLGADAHGTFHPSTASASGALVASAEQVLRWGEALYGGDVLQPGSLRRMTTPNDRVEAGAEPYGLGAMVRVSGDTRMLGHSGSTVGFQSRLRYREADGAVVVVLFNDFFSEADTADAALWNVLDQ